MAQFKYTSSIFTVGNSINVNAQAPIDLREVINGGKETLKKLDTWQTSSGLVIYPGMLTRTTGTDTEPAAVWLYLGQATENDIKSESNWKQLAMASDIPGAEAGTYPLVVKGEVGKYEDLPEDPKQGDVYNVQNPTKVGGVIKPAVGVEGEEGYKPAETATEAHPAGTYYYAGAEKGWICLGGGINIDGLKEEIKNEVKTEFSPYQVRGSVDYVSTEDRSEGDTTSTTLDTLTGLEQGYVYNVINASKEPGDENYVQLDLISCSLLRRVQ